MASTNKTPNYNLPQFLGTDRPSWLGDVNPAMSKIDTQMKLNETNANQAISSSTNAVAVANGASATANNAFNLAEGNTLNVAVNVSAVSGSPLQALPTCYRNYNNTLLNIYFSSDINKEIIVANQALFKLDIHPAVQRMIRVAITFQVITTEGDSKIYFTNLLIDNDGTCRTDGGIDLTGANVSVVGMYINGIYNTYGWYL